MKWIDALRVFNEGKPSWCIPKKGSKDYNTVRSLMQPKEANATPDWDKLYASFPELKRPKDELFWKRLKRSDGSSRKRRSSFIDNEYDDRMGQELDAVREAKAFGKTMYAMPKSKPSQSGPVNILIPRRKKK